MSCKNTILLYGLMLTGCIFLFIVPAHAFTANSLDVTIQGNGDAIATFRFTLQGFIENAIPQQVLEEELKKGLTTTSEPPELISMSRSEAVLRMKKFASTSDVPTGTQYNTVSMDFKKAEIALEGSALSSVVSADFSPSVITLVFPDSYQRQFSNTDTLPAVSHIVEDPVKVAQVLAEARARAEAQAQAQAQAQTQASLAATGTPITSSAAKGSINVTSSPETVKISIDSQYVGESPALLQDIPAGTHVMDFTQDGYSPVRKDVIVNAGKTTNILVVLTYIPSSAVPAEPASFPWLPVLVVLIGICVVGLGAYYTWSDAQRRKKPETESRKRIAGTAAADIRIISGPEGAPDTGRGRDSPAGAVSGREDAVPPTPVNDDMSESRGPADPKNTDSGGAILDPVIPDPVTIVPETTEPADDDTGDECR